MTGVQTCALPISKVVKSHENLLDRPCAHRCPHCVQGSRTLICSASDGLDARRTTRHRSGTRFRIRATERGAERRGSKSRRGDEPIPRPFTRRLTAVPLPGTFVPGFEDESIHRSAAALPGGWCCVATSSIKQDHAARNFARHHALEAFVDFVELIGATDQAIEVDLLRHAHVGENAEIDAWANRAVVGAR